jgi:hypothetical protein
MTPEHLNELTAAAEQLLAIEQVLDLLRDKIRRLEAAGLDAAAYRLVADWLYHRSQARLQAALEARQRQEA